MSIVVAYYHVVIGTKYRHITISEKHKQDLYSYIGGILRKRSCNLLAINGIGNHIHLLLNLHQSVALADLIKEVKRGSSLWIKENKDRFPLFEGWGKEYAAFVVSYARKQAVIDYIARQEIHHNSEVFDQELQRFITAHDIVYRTYSPSDDD